MSSWKRLICCNSFSATTKINFIFLKEANKTSILMPLSAFSKFYSHWITGRHGNNLWILLGPFFRSSILPSVLLIVRKFSRNPSITFFLKPNIVLQATACVAETDSQGKIYLGQKWQKESILHLPRPARDFFDHQRQIKCTSEW